jgi:choline kinase
VNRQSEQTCRNVIILLAGKSSRFYQLNNEAFSEDYPHKSFQEINDKTILQKLIEDLIETMGVDNVILVVSKENQNRFKIALDYFRDSQMGNKPTISRYGKNTNFEIVVNSYAKNFGSSMSVAIGLKKIKEESCSLLIEGDLVLEPKHIVELEGSLGGPNWVLLTPHTNSGDEMVSIFNNGLIESFTKESNQVLLGFPEYIGITHLSAKSSRKFIKIGREKNWPIYEEIICELIKQREEIFNLICSNKIVGYDIDTKEDMVRVKKYFKNRGVKIV